jgi:cytochrome c553
MKVVRLKAAFQTTILAMVFVAPAHADGGYVPASSGGALRAKIEYCTDCHGSSGRGYRGYFPMPRLAGQTTEYFKNQLRAFVEKRRENNIAVIMSRAHGSLSPEMRAALAAHFYGLNPRPFGGAPRHLAATGKQIYEEGIPETNVPACSACHGPDAKGEGSIPRLAGQLYPYTVKELTDWAKERAQRQAPEETSSIMAPIAHSLNKSQIAAVAAYLSDLK